MGKRIVSSPPVDDRFDYSTPEAEEAMRVAIGLILEIREFETSPLAHRVALYERTLGLAVLPVLVRRVVIRLWSLRHPPRGAK